MKIDKVWIDEERETRIPHPPERVLIPSTISGLPDARIYVNGLKRDERPIQLRAGDMIEVRVPPMGTDDVRLRYTAQANTVIEIAGAPPAKTHSVLSLTKAELELLESGLENWRNEFDYGEPDGPGSGQDWSGHELILGRLRKAIASFGP